MQYKEHGWTQQAHAKAGRCKEHGRKTSACAHMYVHVLCPLERLKSHNCNDHSGSKPGDVAISNCMATT